MKTPALQHNKVARLISWYGMDYTFKRAILDGNREPTGEAESIVVRGIFSEHNSSLLAVIGDAGTVASKPKPQVIALWENGLQVKPEDIAEVPSDSGRAYRVTGVDNVGNLDLFAVIALEVQQDELPV